MFSTYNTKLAASSPELREAANIEVKLVLLYLFSRSTTGTAVLAILEVSEKLFKIGGGGVDRVYH